MFLASSIEISRAILPNNGDNKENIKEEDEWEEGQQDYVHGMESGSQKQIKAKGKARKNK